MRGASTWSGSGARPSASARSSFRLFFGLIFGWRFLAAKLTRRHRASCGGVERSGAGGERAGGAGAARRRTEARSRYVEVMAPVTESELAALNAEWRARRLMATCGLNASPERRARGDLRIALSGRTVFGQEQDAGCDRPCAGSRGAVEARRDQRGIAAMTQGCRSEDDAGLKNGKAVAVEFAGKSFLWRLHR